MTTQYDFGFHNMSRIGNDNCDISQKNVQNVKSGNYMLTNYYADDCEMKKPIALATHQPSVFYTGSHQTGVGGCNISENSELFHGLPTKPACKISLFQRPFATVPYLGRGRSNAVLESQIQQGGMVSDKKSISTTSETAQFNPATWPMIPSIKATVTNPARLVEGVAAEGWVRGGLPTHLATYAKYNQPAEQY